MSHTEETVSQTIHVMDWPGESWAKRLPSCAEEAAYIVGRLLNCLAFHAKQALLLSFRNDGLDIDHQYQMVTEAFRALRLRISSFDQSCRERCEKIVDEARVNWEGDWCEWMYDRLAQCNSLPEDWENVYESTRVERCANLFRTLLPEAYADVAAPIKASVSGKLRATIEAGICLDRFVRPLSVHLHMWDVKRGFRYSEHEELRQSALGVLKVCHAMDEEDELIKFRGVNSLANTSRQPGEVPPDPEWEQALSAALHDAGIDMTVSDELREVCVFQQADPKLRRRWAEDLGDDVWRTLNPNLPNFRDRKLMVGSRVVKNLTKHPKGNQVKVLELLQRTGWPAVVDVRSLGLRTQLGDTIKGLNNNQLMKLLVFERQGEESISWKYRPGDI